VKTRQENEFPSFLEGYYKNKKACFVQAFEWWAVSDFNAQKIHQQID